MDALAALIPSAGVAFLFYLAVRAMIGADRRERAAQAELDRVERGRAAKRPAPADGDVNPS
jgi:threonine/homoserine/homoserine lactone efflux protein